MVEGLPNHTPYDGSSRPFTASLKPLALSEWIETDRHFDAYIAEKRRLYAAMPERVFVEEAQTRDAQREALELLRAHLGIAPAGTANEDESPLRAASLLVQEDLILMRASPDGWRLVAGSLCFPSSWSLTEKFGRSMQDIHVPVPGFGRGTRMAEIIDRIFDNLAVDQPVLRYNWSIQAGDALYQPLSNDERIDRAETRPSRFSGDDIARAFIRIERQTLRKLPVSKDILFTIRIHLDPLAVLARHPERSTLARSFATQLSLMDTAQLDYKGLTADRDGLIRTLDAMAASA